MRDPCTIVDIDSCLGGSAVCPPLAPYPDDFDPTLLESIWDEPEPLANCGFAAHDLDDMIGLHLDHFRAYMPAHNYIFAPTGEPWPASSVNSRLASVPLKNRAGEPILDKDGNPRMQKASAWLDENRAVEQMTWAPGLPQVIADKLVSDGGWRHAPGFNVFNLYRPPLPIKGDPERPILGLSTFAGCILTTLRT